MTLRDQQRMGPSNARHYHGTNQLHLTSTSKSLQTAMLPGLSPVSDGRNQQIELHKARADRASLLMRWDKRSSLGCAVGESTLVYIRETERGLSTRLQLVAQGSFQVSFVHESSHPDCYMPDLSPHKAHSGIQICQAQQVRKLRLTMLGT